MTRADESLDKLNMRKTVDDFNCSICKNTNYFTKTPIENVKQRSEPMRKCNLDKIILCAGLLIPMDSLDHWLQLRFNKIPSNQVSIADNSLVVNVASSASPLVYKLKEPTDIVGFVFRIKIIGEMNSEPTAKFEEDSYFRMGLVVAGEKKLGFLQKAIAADWVKKLFSLAPDGIGLDKIYFYNVGHSNNQLNQSRVHPNSDLIFESVVKIKETDMVLHEQKFDVPKNVLAVWLSIDGDQSKSKYQTQIQELKLITKD